MAFTSYGSRDMQKVRIIQRVSDKVIPVAQAAQTLCCSERTIYRYLDTFRTEWPPWFLHGLKGKPSNHSPDTCKHASIRKIIRHHKERYKGWWPTFLAEKLYEIYNITINPESLRQIMIHEGLRQAHQRPYRIKRSMRERKAGYGMMVQFDWCYHDWLGTGEIGCMLCGIDDATGKVVHATFAKSERLQDVYDYRSEYMQYHGKPDIIYVDRHASYKKHHREDHFDEATKTCFELGMQRLWVTVLFAYSPEAKGRVERGFRTHQDRLVKELALAGIKTYEEATVFLRDTYLPKHNTKFSKQPQNEWNYHKPLLDREKDMLDRYFVKEEVRKIWKDATIRLQNKKYLLQRKLIPTATRFVNVQQNLRGEVKIIANNVPIPYSICSSF